MQGKWTKLYHDYLEAVKAELADELKARLKDAIYETDDEIVIQFNIEVSKLFDHLFQDTTSTVPAQKSWFRKRLVEKYEQDQYRYKEGFQIDGFLDFILPEIRKEFDAHYDSADERAKEEIHFDTDFVKFPANEEIIRLLASHDAYLDFFDRKYELKEQLINIIEKEKKLVEVNHFNHLRPVQVYDFFLPLTQLNTDNKKAFLWEKQVYDLANMICHDKPVTEPIDLNIRTDQKTIIIYFFYIFYKYCKDTVDSKGTREKYLSLLPKYVAQFDPELAKVDVKNFAREHPNFPIKIDERFLRWKNA